MIKNTVFITTKDDLQAFCARAAKSAVLGIDTEFMREKTYYPQLCLLQMQTDAETAIVDPFCVHDLAPLGPVLENPGVVKIFHAGTQDIEILYHEVGAMPRPVFDTQVAAALLGHSLQMGYGALVASVCGVSLKKGDSFTDWARRPLTESQLRYAAEDVIYLPKLYRKMTAELNRLGRTHWLEADFAALVDEARYTEDARERFRRLKRVNQLMPRQMAAARELAEWRELRAIDEDVPRKWVLTDEQVVEACKREARTIDELFMVRGVGERLGTQQAREAVAAIVRGLDLPPEQWPELEAGGRNEANVDVEVDLMSSLVRLRARQNNIAFQAIASHADLAAVARGHHDVELMRGWRRKIAGAELLDLLAGKLRLSMGPGGLQVEKVGPTSATMAGGNKANREGATQ